MLVQLLFCSAYTFADHDLHGGVSYFLIDHDVYDKVSVIWGVRYQEEGVQGFKYLMLIFFNSIKYFL